MMRLLLTAMLFAGVAGSAAAQGMNPNSPRAQRDMRVSPPPPSAAPGQVGETLEPTRWPTLSKPLSQPAWGAFGGAGWPGVAAPPQK